MSKKFLTLVSVLAVMFTANSLSAQVPLITATPEGTVITNTASVTYTDANGNTYSPATGTISVTVGFVAFIDVTGQATYTPSSPSTGNNAVYTINNNGNGIDTVQVSSSAGTGVTITGYILNGTPYATLALLNTALNGLSIARTTGTATVTIVYSVGSLYGGSSIPLSLTATSKRDGTKTDTQTTNIAPPVAGGVSVTATTSTINRLPSGSTTYSTSYTVSNGANASRTFNLTAAVGGTATASPTISGGPTATISANGSTTITVTYTVNNVAAGATGTVTLTATAADDALITSTGTHTVTVIKAALSLTKEVFRDNQTTPITATDRVIPGELIWYKLTITNTGAAAASSLSLTDQLPAEVTYNGNTASGSWTVTNTAGTITATLTGTLGASASDVIWIHVTVK